jgi:MFS transporter, DHA3 family, macrolide efflux protein
MNTAARVEWKDRAAFATAFFLSAFGYEVLFFAMTLRVYDISRRAINVGIFTAITFLPKLLSPAYGALVDRFGSRRTISAAAFATALLSACLPLVDALGTLYALWFLLSILFMILGNARTVLMTQVSRSGEYTGVNAVAFSFLNAARLTAPLCAGILSRSIGTKGLTILSAGAYCLCAAAAAVLSGRNFRGSSGAGSTTGKPAAASLGEGFARIRESRDLRLLVGISAIRSLFLGFLPSLLIVLVTSRLGRTSADYGFALTAAAIGSLGGSLAGPLIARSAPTRAVAAIGLGLHFACFASLGILASYRAAIAALIAGSFSLYVAAIVLHSRRDSATEVSTRGRVYGANTMIQTVPSLISMVAGSALADRLGTGPVFVASGTAALAVLIAVSIRVAAAKNRG